VFSDKKPTLGGIRSWLLTVVAVVIMLRIVLWAIEPFFPYILVGIVTITVIGIAINRTTKL